MGLTELKLFDFRGFEQLSLRFHPRLTVLVGGNGSGKTTVLDAIALAIRRGSPRAIDLRVGGATAHADVRTGDGGRFETVAVGKDKGIEEHAPLVLYYRDNRHAGDATPGATKGQEWTSQNARDSWMNAGRSYETFFTWFREMEDLENEQVRYHDAQENAQLAAVRRAIVGLFPDFSQPRVRRAFPPLSNTPVFTLSKGDTVLPFDAFSEGERTAVAMAADIARRLALAAEPPDDDPLAGAAVILIDELEQHLHPGWQRHLVRQLPEVFPGAQFIVTTHSPVVVQEVGAENLRVVEDFQLIPAEHGRGRDANDVLEATFATTARPEDVQKRLDHLSDLLDDARLDEGRELLEALGDELGAYDPDVVFYRQLYERLSAS